MDHEAENLEKKLMSLLGQLLVECGILERMVYKNKNQHRRSSYFQYLLKVRRDTRLLKEAKLEDLVRCCFQLITGKKPKQKVHLLESLKQGKCESGKYNFMERLLGAARLLSEMVEPMMKAAIEISTLLARSFFKGFSLTILALLARLRVLVQQVLLDIVTVFNMVSSLSQKNQSVKITQEGLEVYREVYPTKEEFIILECIWKSDKFVLHETTQKIEIGTQDEHLGGNVTLAPSDVQYQSIDSLLGDVDETIENSGSHVKGNDSNSFTGLLIEDHNGKLVATNTEVGDGSSLIAETSMKKLSREGGLFMDSSSSTSARKSSGLTKVAFVSVKKPQQTISSVVGPCLKDSNINNEEKQDPFFSLLTDGTVKGSSF